MNDIVKPDAKSVTLEKVVIGGDLAALTPSERLSYYLEVCRATGLNPATRPFEYLKLNNKLVLYARKDATEQLRKLNTVSITKLETTRLEDVYVVTAYAKDSKGREDCATGAVTIGSMKGDNLANAVMKAETKAKRRVTLSICGLGLLDETEVPTVAGAIPVVVDNETGEILGDALGPPGDKPWDRTTQNKPPSVVEREKAARAPAYGALYSAARSYLLESEGMAAAASNPRVSAILKEWGLKPGASETDMEAIRKTLVEKTNSLRGGSPPTASKQEAGVIPEGLPF